MKYPATMDKGSGAHGFSWGLLGLLLLLQTTTSLVTLSIGALAPFLHEGLNITYSQVGLFTSSIYAGSLFFGIFCGWVIDKFGVRRFLLLGPWILGVFFLAFTRAPSFGIALTLSFLGGVGYVFVNPCAAKAITTRFPLKTRATAIGIMKSGVTLGGAIGAAVLPQLSLLLGWRNALAIFIVLVILVAPVATIFYRELPGQKSNNTSVLGIKELREVLKSGGILLLGGMGITYSAVQLSLSTYLVLFLHEASALSVVTSGTYLTVALASGMVGRILLGAISDRIFNGRRKVGLVIVGFLNIAACTILALWTTVIPSWVLYVVVAIFGFAAFGWVGLYITFLSELGNRQKAAATAVGFGTACGSVGILLGPPLFGHIIDTTSSYTTAWLALSVISVIACALIALVREERCGKVPAGG